MNYNVGLYIRLSREDGDKEESESVTNQRKILQDYVKENDNYKIYNEYVDDGYSGTNFDRPAFKKMIKDIEDKKINMVITKSLSRLGRDYIDTGYYIEKYFPENEIRYIALLDDVDTFLDKNCEIAAFKNIMNDFYAKETSKNVKKTKNRKKKEGFYYISVPPYGYDKIDKAGNLKINELQAEVIRKIYIMFLDGYGTYQIACILNNENSKKKWSHVTVKRVLTNPVYFGTCVQNKTKKISYKSKKIIKLSKEEYTITKNHHEGIISKETFDMVQDIFDRSKNIKVNSKNDILKPFIYCKKCGNIMFLIKKKDAMKTRKYLVCKNCKGKYINYEIVEKQVLEKMEKIIEKYMSSLEYEKIVEKAVAKVNRNKENVKKEIEKVECKLKKLYLDKLEEVIEQEDFEMIEEELKSQKTELEKILKKKTKNVKMLSSIDIIKNLIDKIMIGDNIEVTLKIKSKN